MNLGHWLAWLHEWASLHTVEREAMSLTHLWHTSYELAVEIVCEWVEVALIQELGWLLSPQHAAILRRIRI